MDLYGVKEVDDEEEDQENKKTDKNKLNIDQSGINIQGKDKQNMIINSNPGIGFNSQKKTNSKMGMGNSSQFNFGVKNKSKNAYEAFNINLKANDKGKTELEKNTSGMLFNGTINEINLSQQPDGNEINSIPS